MAIKHNYTATGTNDATKQVSVNRWNEDHVIDDGTFTIAKTSGLQTALDGKEASITAGTTGQYWRGDKSWQTLDKTAVGLGNVDNTSDSTKNSETATLTNKTISGSSNTLSNIAQSSVTNLTTDLEAKAATASNNTFTKAQRGSITTLTDAATIALDFNDNNFFTVTLGGNRTLGNPSNEVAGQSGSIFIVQDATGSRTLAYSSDWDFPGGTAPTLTTTANAVDRLDYLVRSSGSIHAVLTKDVK
jgi:hypothetical protein